MYVAAILGLVEHAWRLRTCTRHGVDLFRQCGAVFRPKTSNQSDTLTSIPQSKLGHSRYKLSFVPNGVCHAPWLYTAWLHCTCSIVQYMYSAVWMVTPTQPQCAAPCFLFQLMRTYGSAQFAPSSGTEAAQLARVWHPRRYYTISPAIECLQRETLAWREDRIWLMTRPNPHKYAVSFFKI